MALSSRTQGNNRFLLRLHWISAHLFLTLLVLIYGCAHKKEVLRPGLSVYNPQNGELISGLGNDLHLRPPVGDQIPAQKGLARKILETAYAQTGRPYHSGGNSPQTGFNCPGFTQWVYGRYGLRLPDTVKEQLKAGIHIRQEELRPGDLMIYWRSQARKSLHVGIYTGDGNYLYGPQTGEKVREARAFDPHRQALFIAARRVINDPEAAPLSEAEKKAVIAQAMAARVQAMKKKLSESKAGSNKARTNKDQPNKLQKYRVQKGDNIWILARRFKVSTQKLLQANGLGQKHTLHIGQTLMIP